jgi:hypothetical protein
MFTEKMLHMIDNQKEWADIYRFQQITIKRIKQKKFKDDQALRLKLTTPPSIAAAHSKFLPEYIKE